MAEVKRIAVVTGANKGIGLEVVRQLASHGINVVLTARDEKRGLDALHKLKKSSGLSGDVIFHQLDVADSSSVASLAEIIKTRFGRLDILVNNAAVLGAVSDGDAFTTVVRALVGEPNINVNCVCPAYVTTDMTYHTGIFTVEEDADRILKLALLPDDALLFSIQGEVSSFY